MPLPGSWLIEWGGAQRWLKTDVDARMVRDTAEQAGGHAMLFRGEEGVDTFHPLPAGLLALHRNLKLAFDPYGIFNPGRLF